MNKVPLTVGMLAGAFWSASSPRAHAHLVEGPEGVFHNLFHAMTDAHVFPVAAVALAVGLLFFGLRAMMRMR